MRRPRAAAAALLAAAAVLVCLSGCLAVTDEPAAWREDARVAAGDARSQLLTVRLVLVRHERLPGRYDASVVLAAEKAVATAADDLARSQPPASLRPTYDRLGALLEDASGLAAEARTAVGEGDTAEYAGLVRSIDRLAPRIEAVEQELRG